MEKISRRVRIYQIFVILMMLVFASSSVNIRYSPDPVVTRITDINIQYDLSTLIDDFYYFPFNINWELWNPAHGDFELGTDTNCGLFPLFIINEEQYSGNYGCEPIITVKTFTSGLNTRNFSGILQLPSSIYDGVVTTGSLGRVRMVNSFGIALYSDISINAAGMTITDTQTSEYWGEFNGTSILFIAIVSTLLIGLAILPEFFITKVILN
ncbi:MAG: hypothetical protein INQ03_11210 [Candidatus Heimdallarchaeota archaeon]|nr:hypothetical protein [Candidatus Heimdallarchaeota archaeon]